MGVHTNASHNMASEERSGILIEEHPKGFRLRTRTLRVNQSTCPGQITPKMQKET